jgi:hypothetical protein
MSIDPQLPIRPKSVKSAKSTPAPTDIAPPVRRPLKAYAFDPSAGRLLGNEMAMNVRYQHLEPGPVVRDRQGDPIAVVDYDGANQTYYRPVDLDDPRILIRGGLDPDETNPRFHQQMLYAVVTETIQHFEQALGRRIHWRRGLREENPDTWGDEHIWTLLLFPHAFIGANAFYSPDAHGILFGYFRAQGENVGRNLPGQVVFTCLSHDVIVHETTHAVIDGMRRFFTEQTNPDVAAFHEAVADLAALFRHFTHGEVLRDTLQRTGGALFKYQLRADVGPEATGDASDGDKTLSSETPAENPLIALAQQFGQATGKQRALRSALGVKATPEAIKTITEPHERGSILVAAVFDAFFSQYVRRTADLWTIYRAGGGSRDPIDIPKALADRLCDEAVRLAEEFFQICMRALDYCPPVDITFGTYLRALVTADADLYPVDRWGVRDSLMESFRMRGIVPTGAGFFSEGSIAWPRAEAMGLPPVIGLEFGDPTGLTKLQKDGVRKVLQAYVDDPVNRVTLGFDPVIPVAVPSFHPVFRINLDGSLRTDMVVEMVQTRPAPIHAGVPDSGSFPFRGGATLIIQKPTLDDIESGQPHACIRYVIAKHLVGADGAQREARQRRNIDHLGLADGNDSNRFRVNFALVHGA